MSTFHDAADVLKREAGRYRALMQAAEALDKIGSLDQAANEAKARKELFEAEAEALQERVNQSKQDMETISADLAEKVIAARDQATGIVAAAEESASDTIADAQSRAADIIQTGQTSASQELAKMAEKVATMQATLSRLIEQNNTAVERRDQAIAAATEAEAKLASVQARIRKLAEA